VSLSGLDRRERDLISYGHAYEAVILDIVAVCLMEISVIAATDPTRSLTSVRNVHIRNVKNAHGQRLQTTDSWERYSHGFQLFLMKLTSVMLPSRGYHRRHTIAIYACCRFEDMHDRNSVSN
jgi:hypothetical protein